MATPLFGSFYNRYRVQQRRHDSREWYTVKAFGTLELAQQFAQSIRQQGALRQVRVLDFVTGNIYEIPLARS